MSEIDVEDENLVYVPECRESTIKRLLQSGYVESGRILFQDEFGEKVMMVAMKKKLDDEKEE